MGLEWMLGPIGSIGREPATTSDQAGEPQAEEIKREHPRELNLHLKNYGTGYPEVEEGKKAEGNQHMSSSVVGDGGASWRSKTLKRAQEQAVREGQNFKEVVKERWGSVGQLEVSVASHTAASSRAHLHAINNRKRGLTGEHQPVVEDHNEKIPGKNTDRESQWDVSCRRSEMKVPKLHDSSSWGKQKRETMSSEDSGLISSALSSLNKFANDGSFMNEVTRQKDDEPGGSVGSPNRERKVESESVPSASFTVVNEGLSANQLAAKALQFHLKGKHEEAEKLMKEAKNVKPKQVAEDESSWPPSERRYTALDTSIRQRKKEDDADTHLAQKIVQNKKFSVSAQADDEYDFDDGPRRKAKIKGGTDQKLKEKSSFSKRILTQQERCKFCFENLNRPRYPASIDEAKDEWSQYNSKKLIDTSVKGLRGSVPKDFPYFHVEFGLNKGFVHVIDDEQQFKANFGLNVVRGMLKLLEEDTCGRRKHDSEETIKASCFEFCPRLGTF